MQVQESELIMGMEINPTHSSSKIQEKDVQNSETSLSKDYQWLLEKVRKKYTQHPISNFISFNKLPSSHGSFLSQLNPIKIPQTA